MRLTLLAGCCTLIFCLIHPARSSAESASKTVRVSATILPRLELSVSPSTGNEIAFGTIEQPAPGDPASRSVEVRIAAFSNLGRPYHISQTVRRPLTNSEGSSIAEEQFLVATHDAVHGQAENPQPTPIPTGAPTTLYTSNARGKSDAFRADYTLVVTPSTPAGEFDTEIVYTLTSL